jgi:uncharacterized GH25 family protein
MRYSAISLLFLSLLASPGWCHDTWVQTNTNLVRTGDVVHIDLMLGNHGNQHRDFKLASKVSPESCTLEVVAPGGKRYDLKPDLVDLGYAPKEGFWSARFVPGAAGLYAVAQTMDGVFHGVRGVRSAKTYFVASDLLDKVDADIRGFEKPLGHALELVPAAHPVAPMGPGLPLRVQVLYQGKPHPKARTSFIPRGVTSAEGFDTTYERMTDDSGMAEFTPTEGNYYLVVVHHDEPEQKGEDYNATRYTATLAVFVPQVCPCCGE